MEQKHWYEQSWSRRVPYVVAALVGFVVLLSSGPKLKCGSNAERSFCVVSFDSKSLVGSVVAATSDSR